MVIWCEGIGLVIDSLELGITCVLHHCTMCTKHLNLRLDSPHLPSGVTVIGRLHSTPTFYCTFSSHSISTILLPFYCKFHCSHSTAHSLPILPQPFYSDSSAYSLPIYYTFIDHTTLILLNTLLQIYSDSTFSSHSLPHAYRPILL